jgi:hypothetical protein
VVAFSLDRERQACRVRRLLSGLCRTGVRRRRTLVAVVAVIAVAVWFFLGWTPLASGRRSVFPLEIQSARKLSGYRDPTREVPLMRSARKQAYPRIELNEPPQLRPDASEIKQPPSHVGSSRAGQDAAAPEAAGAHMQRFSLDWWLRLVPFVLLAAFAVPIVVAASQAHSVWKFVAPLGDSLGGSRF